TAARRRVVDARDHARRTGTGIEIQTLPRAEWPRDEDRVAGAVDRRVLKLALERAAERIGVVARGNGRAGERQRVGKIALKDHHREGERRRGDPSQTHAHKNLLVTAEGDSATLPRGCAVIQVRSAFDTVVSARIFAGGVCTRGENARSAP